MLKTVPLFRRTSTGAYLFLPSSGDFLVLSANFAVNSPDVAFQLTVNSINKRKYPNINEGDEVKIYDSGQGKYGSRKETTSKWSTTTYKVEKVDRDINLNKYYVLENLNRNYNRNELLLI